MASWNPQRLVRDWIIDQIAEEYYRGKAEVPRELFEAGAIIPVLDGLDEIPRTLRAAAIRHLNRYLGGDHPMVLTSRGPEYQDAVSTANAVIGGAAVVKWRGFRRRTPSLISPLHEMLMVTPGQRSSRNCATIPPGQSQLPSIHH